MTASMPPLVGGILVGGASRRFGSPKALAVLGGVPLAERVAAALAEVVDDLVLLGSGPVPASLECLDRARDRDGAGGPLAGVLGFFDADAGRRRALLAVACDQALLEAEACAWLAGHRRDGVAAVVARWREGGIEPLPGVYEPASRPLLESLADGGGSLQPLTTFAEVLVVEPPEALRGAWTSIDTRQKLEAARAASPG